MPPCHEGWWSVVCRERVRRSISGSDAPSQLQVPSLTAVWINAAWGLSGQRARESLANLAPPGGVPREVLDVPGYG